MSNERVILAADELSLEECLTFTQRIGPHLHAVKVHNICDRHGIGGVVSLLREAGARGVFVDYKLKDIPNTVGLRTRAIAEAGANILTVHASGGIDMMAAAVANAGQMKIFAITVLTSLTEEDAHLNYGQPSKAAVLRFARDAKLAGVHDIVCSPKEVGILAKRPELKGLEFVTPGIRAAGKGADDQQRVDTATAAIKAGASYLVIGRPIIQAPDPLTALEEFTLEVEQAQAA